ncbi:MULTISPECIES: hypothetical protein [unclassified Halobacteriovorax]|uniref:hypothetical protein n=1 Tax=unclassified Halobacteriovorax TaxID=2639665 RepID=UPI002FF321ED
MNSKLFLILILLSSCGVKAPPKPKNQNFPSFIEENKKVLRPSKTTKQETKKKEDNN